MGVTVPPSFDFVTSPIVDVRNLRRSGWISTLRFIEELRDKSDESFRSKPLSWDYRLSFKVCYESKCSYHDRDEQVAMISHDVVSDRGNSICLTELDNV
jgi:hypothetical protein